MENQFLRTEIILGKHALEKLQNNFVVIVGLGAVGSFATEALARLGIKNFRLIDFDNVCPTNINRQLYALHSTVGEKKHILAKNRVSDINPDAKVESLDLFADSETFQHIFAPHSDGDNPTVLVDAIDSLSPKVRLLEEGIKRKIPTFSAMGAATRRDPSKVKIADIADTFACPLAAQVRRRLRKLQIEQGITCIFSTEPANRNALLPSPQEANESAQYKRPNVLGSLPTITGIMGLFLAHAVMEYLLKHTET